MSLGISQAQGFDFLGGAVKDLFGAAGANAEGQAYGEAAKYAGENAQISAESAKIQEYQAGRQLVQVIGKGVAATGANGLTGGGSSEDIMRSSAAQGALQQQVIGEQGLINETSYKEQEAQYKGMQTAAQASTAGQGLGGLISGIAGIAGIFAL